MKSRILFGKIVNRIGILGITLILFVFAKALAQTTENPNGFNQYFHPNGKVSSEGYLRDGKPDGYWKTYYENGVLKSEGNRKNFLLDSTWKFYDPQGKLTLEINYREGKKNGKRITYKADITIEENFKNDIKDGLTRYIDSKGRVIKEALFVDGIPFGIEKEYDTTGRIINVKEYKNGYLVLEEPINRYDSENKKHGKWKEYYDNGKVKKEENYRYGKRFGYYKEFDENGSLTVLKKYENDKEIVESPELTSLDIVYDYYENGKIKIVGSYKNGVPEGTRREFDSTGKVIKSYIFRNGAVVGEGIIDDAGYKQGDWKEYYENGQLSGEGKYLNNKRIGLWKYYHPNGKLEQIGVFVQNEKPDGEWKWYYDNGQLRREMTYERGVEEGMMIEYSDTGGVILKGKYVEGLKEGKWYSATGDYAEEGEYKNGARTGLWVGTYRNGNRAFEGTYTDDLPDGKHTWYYPDGKLWKTGRYVMGKKEGEWVEMNPRDNTVFLSTIYKNGVEVSYNGVIIKPEFEPADVEIQY